MSKVEEKSPTKHNEEMDEDLVSDEGIECVR